jgi:two-component system, chemotaxis family, chemotaxis protein CheY
MAKILVVDDSDVIRMEVKAMLEGKGHSVVEAANGAEGITTAMANPDISLLISDVNMPVMDGITMCKQIKEKPEFAKLPIFMLTTESGADLKAQGKAAGVMLWVVKPPNPEKFMDVVAKVVPA